MYLIKNKEGEILGYVKSHELLNLLKSVRNDIESEEVFEIEIPAEQCYDKVLTRFWSSVHEINQNCHVGCIAVVLASENGVDTTCATECREMFEGIKDEVVFNNLVIEEERTLGALTIKDVKYPDSILKDWKTIFELEIWKKDWSNDKKDYEGINVQEQVAPGRRACILLNDKFEFELVELPEIAD